MSRYQVHGLFDVVWQLSKIFLEGVDGTILAIEHVYPGNFVGEVGSPCISSFPS